MRTNPLAARLIALAALVLALGTTSWGCGRSGGGASGADVEILNVSYDPTRELYEEIDAAFARAWLARTGQRVTVKQSHGGSGKQARAVIDGLEADVVTLGLAYDVDAVARSGLLSPDWAARLPHHSTPFASSIVFLVRKGNPKHIVDWDDLARPGIAVITPNPKTSGGARWNYLAAWAAARAKGGGDEARAAQSVAAIYKNVAVLDSGARSATTTFVERGIGDVLVAWDSEARLAQAKLGADRFDRVVPPRTILAETPVAVVDAVVAKHGTRAVAEAYAQFLFGEEAQAIAEKHFYRRTDGKTETQAQAQAEQLFTIDDTFGGWQKAQATHFAEGGTLDVALAAVER